jgi:hypothetical protein
MMDNCFQRCAVILLLGVWLMPTSSADDSRELLSRLARERKVLEQAMRKGNSEKALATLKAIGAMDSPAGVKYLLSLAHVQPRQLYDAVVEVIPGSRSETMWNLLADMYEAESKQQPGDWTRRVMLLDALSTFPDQRSIDAFSLAVRDAHPKVRLAAIRSLHRLSSPADGKIPAWIDSLAASEAASDIGTPHVEARTHLYKHTARDFLDATSWRDYWQANSQGYEAPETEPEEGIAYEESAEYYGDRVTSRRVLFIIDTSGSMNIFDHEGWPNVPRAPYGDSLSGNLGTDSGGSPITNPLWKQWIAANPLSIRIDRAKAELIRLIDELPINTYFNIIAFGSRPVAWRRRLEPVGDANVLAAKQFVDALRPEGATAADLALAAAFDANSVADTIYFLSDGEPSRDGINLLPIAPLLAQIEGANRFHRIIIHTLGFGRQGEQFMKLLSEQNGGQYRRIVGPPAWAAR